MICIQKTFHKKTYTCSCSKKRNNSQGRKALRKPNISINNPLPSKKTLYILA